MSVEVSEKFMEALVVRYSAVLKAKEVQKELRRYSSKHYNTRKLRKELRRLYNDILTAEPEEIPRLRAEYLALREKISEIVGARNNDPTVKALREESKTLRDAVRRLDEAIVRELRNYGYEVKPMESDMVESKVRELIPEPRQVPGESNQPVEVAGETEPVTG